MRGQHTDLCALGLPELANALDVGVDVPTGTTGIRVRQGVVAHKVDLRESQAPVVVCTLYMLIRD
jgi:hypothetical protein